MTRYLFVCIVLTIGCQFNAVASGILNYKGTIGKYPIELEINHNDWEKGTFFGKYRYAGKKTYLTLNGRIHDDCYYVEESYQGKHTGEFYLTKEEDKLTGYWVSGVKSFAVELEYLSGDMNLLRAKSLVDFSSPLSTALTGSYGNEVYFLNDMWYEEGKPDVEIGFNGGHAVFEEITEDSLRFSFEIICGPTYHFAFGDGVAVKRDSIYIWENEDGCHIEFTPGLKSMFIEANNTMECGFGARAYVHHEFAKISEEHSFDETSLEKLKDIRKE